MRTITKEVNVYTLKEVESNKALLEKVLDKYRFINVEGHDWYGFILEDFTEKLEELGYSDVKIAFSGFCFQGDGASFTAENLNLNSEVLDRLGITKELKHSRIELIKSFISVSINRTMNDYVHENSTETGISIDYTFRNRVDDFLDKISEDIRDKVNEEIYKLNFEIYNLLKNSYYELISNESVLDTLEINEYEFLEDGNIA